MKGQTHGESDAERQAGMLIESLSKLDKDAQAAAILDMEKALAGSPQIALPNWLKGISQDVIIRARIQLQNSVNNRGN